MNGRILLQLLLKKHGLTANSLAKALRGQTTQPQIHKFLTGVAAEPRRSTLAPVAAYFDLPVEVFYDEALAEKIAERIGLVPPEPLIIKSPHETTLSWLDGYMVGEVEEATEQKHSDGTAHPLPQRETPSIREALRAIRNALAKEGSGVRHAVTFLLADIVMKADDEPFTEEMIERTVGVLGQGNAAQPGSTNSSQNADKDAA